MKTEVLEGIVKSSSNRRNFLKTVGTTSLGIAAASMMGDGFLGKAYAAGPINDTDILNFALNLEYLEAEFYSVSTYNSNLMQLGVLNQGEESGPTYGGRGVPNFGNSMEATIATHLRETEIAHVRYLRAALGSAAVKKPAINLNALGYGFANVNDWLKLARQFEDVGVSAYLGAAPLISSKTYLSAAGAILSTEAFHAGSIRWACIERGVYSPAVDNQDIPPSANTPWAINAQALAIPRTTAQVLHIVYGGGNCSGGFFPEGMNGAITCQS